MALLNEAETVPKDSGFSIRIRLSAHCDIGLDYESRVNEVEVSLTYTVMPNEVRSGAMNRPRRH